MLPLCNSSAHLWRSFVFFSFWVWFWWISFPLSLPRQSRCFWIWTPVLQDFQPFSLGSNVCLISCLPGHNGGEHSKNKKHNMIFCSAFAFFVFLGFFFTQIYYNIVLWCLLGSALRSPHFEFLALCIGRVYSALCYLIWFEHRSRPLVRTS